MYCECGYLRKLATKKNRDVNSAFTDVRLPPHSMHNRAAPHVQDIHCCEVCGMLAHDSCHRHARPYCKPVALEALSMKHAWRAAGVILPSSEVRGRFRY